MLFGGGRWSRLALALDCTFLAFTCWKCIYFVPEIGEYIHRETSILEQSNMLGSQNDLLRRHFLLSRELLIEGGKQT